MFYLGTMILRLAFETKGIEEIEERLAGLVYELGRSIIQAINFHLDQELMRKRPAKCFQNKRKSVKLPF